LPKQRWLDCQAETRQFSVPNLQNQPVSSFNSSALNNEPFLDTVRLDKIFDYAIIPGKTKRRLIYRDPIDSSVE